MSAPPSDAANNANGRSRKRSATFHPHNDAAREAPPPSVQLRVHYERTLTRVERATRVGGG